MYLVDTFEGVPLERWSQAEIAAGADSAQWAYVQQAATRDVYAEVVEKFQGFSSVKVIRGVVPDILGEIDSTSIGCLLLDLNCAYPEEKALNRLWDKVVTGGLIISDDFGHSRPGEGYYQQKLMFDEFAKSKGLPVLTLPTGHGLVVKC